MRVLVSRVRTTRIIIVVFSVMLDWRFRRSIRAVVVVGRMLWMRIVGWSTVITMRTPGRNIVLVLPIRYIIVIRVRAWGIIVQVRLFQVARWRVIRPRWMHILTLRFLGAKNIHQVGRNRQGRSLHVLAAP